MVERYPSKLDVAGSNPVIRSSFEDLFEGVFDNELQAKSGSQWSWIIHTHKKIDDGVFECSSAYKFDENNPYKKSVVKLSYGDDTIVAKIYDFDSLTYKEGCDIIFTLQPDNTYLGRNSCRDCFVPWEGNQTFLISSIRMGPDYYWSLDIGLDVETKELVWGSKYGYLKFTRLCSSVG